MHGRRAQHHWRHGTRRIYCASVALTFGLALAPTAGAAQSISDARATASTPVLGVAPNGSAVAVWQRLTSERNAAVTRIAAAFRSPRGQWSRERIISEPLNGISSDQDPPAVAMTAAGAVAVWTRQEQGRADSIYAATMSSGGRWSRPRRLGTGNEPKVGMDQGQALVTWLPYTTDTVPGSIEARWLSNGRWGPIRTAVRIPAIIGHQVALNGRGSGALVFDAVNAKDHDVVYASALRGGRFGRPHLLSRAGDAGLGTDDLCTAPGRPLTAVWMEDTAAATTVATASLSGRGWGQTTTLTSDGGFPRCAVDASGDVVAGWVGRRVPRAAAALRPAGAAWQPSVALSSETESAVRIAVGIGGDGIATADWLTAPFGQALNHVESAAHSASGWTTPRTLSGNDVDGLAVGSDARGHPLSVWDERAVIVAG